MDFNREQIRLYAVTDRSWLRGKTLYEQVEKALKGGVTMVQLREKNLDEQAFEDEAKQILCLCRHYRVPLIINDQVKLAAKIDADGVHIGQSDMELKEARAILGRNKIIGVTAKTVGQALQAERGGADYLGSGAVFGSSTKTDAKPMEMSLLNEICRSVNIPVAAIGGISQTNVEKLSGSAIAGIAVVSGIFAADDIEEAAKSLRKSIEKILNAQKTE